MDGVLYLMVGTKHAEHLAMSIYTLRNHWHGQIAILVGDDNANEYCERFTSIPEVQLIRFDYSTMSKGSGSMYLTKTQMHLLSPFDRTVFMDADTLVVDDISEVFPKGSEINITDWMGWTTAGKMISGRIAKWKDVAPREVDRMLSKEWPAINTGVIGFSKKCKTQMDAWREMTLRNVSFICDEIAMQIIYPDYEYNILDSRYNASPIFPETWKRYRVELDRDVQLMSIEHDGKQVPIITQEQLARLREWSMFGCDKPGICIWHGHGNKFIKKAHGRAVWWPIYQRAIKDNFCGIADWTPFNLGKPRRHCKLVALLANPQRWP